MATMSQDAERSARRVSFFRTEGAPSLDDTGMMSAPEFPNLASGDEAPMPPEGMIRESRVTVPFRDPGGSGLSLVVADFGPGYLLPRHSHSSDCAYYVLAGQAIMGKRVLEAGDGFFVPKNCPYAYRAGPEGVKVLEVRNSCSFDIRVLERDLGRYHESFTTSLSAANRTD